MRSIDFTQQGGFPLTQDTLAWLQTAYTETVLAITKLGGTGPFIVNGCVSSGSSISAGWIFFNGDLLYFPGASIPSAIYPDVLVGVVSETDTTLTFNNPTAPANAAVMKLKQLALANGSNITNATQFPWTTLQDFYTSFGIQGRESAFYNLNVTTGAGNGTVTGTINYKKNNIANTLQIKGVLSAASPSDFQGAASATSSVMGTLATGYRPGQDAPFLCNVIFESLDDAGLDYLRTYEAYIGTDGTINIQWIKPASGVTVTGCLFNAVIPLD